MQGKWSMVKLGEVLTERREKPDLYSILNSEIPIVAKIGFDTGRIELREESRTKTKMILIKPGDLVISGINAAKGAIAIYGEENTTPAAATIHYSSYNINKKKADSIYLWYFMRSDIFRSILVSSLPGGIKTEAKPKRLLPIEIPLPSLEDQKRIVAKIENLMRKIEDISKFKAKSVEEADRLISSVLSKTFSKINNRRRLGDGLFEVICRYPTFYNIDYQESGIGVLKIENITLDKWDIDFRTKCAFISPETNQRFYKTILEKGDLIMAARGATIGKTAFVTSEFEGFNINANLLRLKPNKEILDGQYFWYFMKSPEGKTQFHGLVKSTAKQTITVPRLTSISIHLPPLPEQHRIVANLDSIQVKIDKLKELQIQTERDIENLNLSILDTAFTGEL